MFEQIQSRSFLLKDALDGLQKRQQVTSNNIANVDTPGYKARQVDFESVLQQKRQQARAARSLPEATLDRQGMYTHAEHMPLEPQHNFHISQVPGTMRNDGNGVDLDLEMATLADAQIRYNAVSQSLTQRYAQLKYVIAEGGR